MSLGRRVPWSSARILGSAARACCCSSIGATACSCTRCHGGERTDAHGFLSVIARGTCEQLRPQHTVLCDPL